MVDAMAGLWSTADVADNTATAPKEAAMTITAFAEKRAHQAVRQELINLQADKADAIRRVADEAHAQYPQYAGHWDTWTLARIGRDVTTKGGEAFHAGDYVLAKSEPHLFGEVRVVAYSVRLGWDVEIGAYVPISFV